MIDLCTLPVLWRSPWDGNFGLELVKDSQECSDVGKHSQGQHKLWVWGLKHHLSYSTSRRNFSLEYLVVLGQNGQLSCMYWFIPKKRQLQLHGMCPTILLPPITLAGVSVCEVISENISCDGLRGCIHCSTISWWRQGVGTWPEIVRMRKMFYHFFLAGWSKFLAPWWATDW